ncbi:endonuclease exonuclease phosphatase family protein, partial [Cystoisospora suis]
MSFQRQQREVLKAREGWMNAMIQPSSKDTSSSSSSPSSPGVRPFVSPTSPFPQEEDLFFSPSSSSSSSSAGNATTPPCETHVPSRVQGDDNERGAGEGGNRGRGGLLREEKKLESLRSVRGVGELFDLTAHNLTNLVHATDDGYQASLAHSHLPISSDTKKSAVSSSIERGSGDEQLRHTGRRASRGVGRGGGGGEKSGSAVGGGDCAYRHCHTSDGHLEGEEEEGFSSNLRESLHLSSSSSPEISYSHGSSIGRSEGEKKKKSSSDASGPSLAQSSSSSSRSWRPKETEETEGKERGIAHGALPPSSLYYSHDASPSVSQSGSSPLSSSSSSSAKWEAHAAVGESFSRHQPPRQGHAEEEEKAEGLLHSHRRHERDRDNAKVHEGEGGMSTTIHNNSLLHASGPNQRHAFARSSAYIGRDEARPGVPAGGLTGASLDSSSGGSASPRSPSLSSSPRPKISSSSTNRTGGGRTREGGEEGEMKSIRAVFQQMQKDRYQNSRITRARPGMKKDNSLRNAEPIRIFCGTWNSEYQEFPPGAMSSSPSSTSSSSAAAGVTGGGRGVGNSSSSSSSLPPELPERLVEELLDDEDAWATGEMSGASPSLQGGSLSMKTLPSDSPSKFSTQGGVSSLKKTERGKANSPPTGDDPKSIADRTQATLDGTGGGVRTPQGHPSTLSASSSSTTRGSASSSSSLSHVVSKSSRAGNPQGVGKATTGDPSSDHSRSDRRDRSSLSSSASGGVVNKERMKGGEENASHEREKEGHRDANGRHISCVFSTNTTSSTSGGSLNAREDVKMVTRKSLMRASTLSLQDVRQGEQPLRDWILPGYDVYVITLQETISDNVFQTITAYLSQENGRPYRRMQAVEDRISGLGDGAWTQFKSTSIAAWAREDLLKPRGPVEFVSSKAIPLSFFNGSKGAVSLLLRIWEQYICVLGCHMPANSIDDRIKARVCILERLCEGYSGVPNATMDGVFHHVLWMGDFNFRTRNISADEAIDLLEKGKLKTLLGYDESFGPAGADMRQAGFTEAEISFPPTYKKVDGRPPVNFSDPHWPRREYQTKFTVKWYKGGHQEDRLPSWTDRIFRWSTPELSSLLRAEKDRYFAAMPTRP